MGEHKPFDLVYKRARSWGTRLADLILPPLCPVTGDLVDRPGALSPAAWRDLSFITAPMCPACGQPFEADLGAEAVCAPCAAPPGPDRLISASGLDQVRAALSYDDLAAQLILGLKYGDQTEGALVLARLLVPTLGQVQTPDLLVPVPLHRKRLRQRRFNQAALLAQALSRLTQVPVAVDLLTRTRDTGSQKGLTHDQRARNVKGAFGLTPKYRDTVTGAHIALVDDVLTTGSTLTACATRLKRAGAARVSALAVARVVNPVPGRI